MERQLCSFKYVFLRIDQVRTPEEPPYYGPYLVVKQGKKWFRIVIEGEEKDVSIDRLKPA